LFDIQTPGMTKWVPVNSSHDQLVTRPTRHNSQLVTQSTRHTVNSSHSQFVRMSWL